MNIALLFGQNWPILATFQSPFKIREIDFWSKLAKIPSLNATYLTVYTPNRDAFTLLLEKKLIVLVGHEIFTIFALSAFFHRLFVRLYLQFSFALKHSSPLTYDIIEAFSEDFWRGLFGRGLIREMKSDKKGMEETKYTNIQLDLHNIISLV